MDRLEERRSSLTIVLDASATAPLFLDDERDGILPDLPERLAQSVVFVPAHWRAEIINALFVAVRRGRIDTAGETAAKRMLEGMLVQVDQTATSDLLGAGWRLAGRHRLTIYDAAYLELALRNDARLATNDRALIKAAMAEGVGLFGR